MIRTILFLVILHSCTFSLAQEAQAIVPIAAQTQPARKPNNTTPSAPEGWHFRFSPYLWLSGIHGTVGVGGPMRVCMLGSETLFPILISG